MRSAPILSALALASASAVSLVPTTAEACGGFFCSRTPIDQTGERIVFVMGETPAGLPTVEAHVQVSYTGTAESFAWVVPMPARPTIGISSPQLFNWVDRATQPQFNLTFDQGCGFRNFGPVFAGGAPESAVDDADGGGRGVSVVAVQDVGPYTAATLQATQSEALTTWLRGNGYDVTDQGAAALIPYLGEKYYFVALKLQRGREVGDLKPIKLNFEHSTPCIPIQLTAIAARPDMPIIAYVFASHRAVPTNYMHVLINESRIDWLNFGSNYRQVASAAVDEAGGRAFLTEFAGDVVALRQQWGPVWFNELDATRLAAITDPVDFWLAVMQGGFPQDGLLALAQRYIPKPASLTDTDDATFYNRIDQFRRAIAEDTGREPFDAAAFASDLQAFVVEPLREAEAIIGAPRYLTRLFTTMSADEMTSDPEFAFNDELGDVSNVHTAKALCDLSGENVQVTLEDGRSFRTTFGAPPLADGPAASRIEQMFATGLPRVETDNSDVIDRVIGAGCGGCDAGSGGALALAGLAALLRRRRS